jgi:hypothetical protein
MNLLTFEFEALTEENNHSEAAKLVIDALGTEAERAELTEIIAMHDKRGYIRQADQARRDALVKKYWAEFINL